MRPPTGLFVYGTLRTGGSHGELLAPFQRHEARVRARLYDLPEGYPAIVLDGATEWVHGEFIEAVTDKVIGMLDLYEGVEEGLYQRVVVEAWLGLRPVAAWAWVMQHPERDGGVLVPSGRWRPVAEALNPGR